MIEKEKITFEGYKTYRNDRDNDGGGIMIGIQRQLEKITTIVEKQKVDGESLWILINNKQLAIRVGAIYAPQESRTSKEKYKVMYQKIEEQILMAKQHKQHLLMMGDFNCKIGKSIKNNNAEVSKSGKNFNKMIEKNKLIVLNAVDSCVGTWTREEGGSKSVLDYVVIDQEDERAVVDVKIDEEKEYAPVNLGENLGVTSDHNAILTKLNWLVETENIKKAPRTIITKKGYAKIEEGIRERNLVNIFSKDEPVDELYEEFKGEMDKLIEQNKTTLKKDNKRKSIRVLIKVKKSIKQKIKREGQNLDKNSKYLLIARMKIIDEAIVEEGQKQYQQKIEKVVEQLKGNNGMNVPNMWKVMKKVERRKVEPPTAVKSKEGVVIEEPEKIKERYLEHFAEILQNVPAETQEEKEQEQFIEEVFHRMMMLADTKDT